MFIKNYIQKSIEVKKAILENENLLNKIQEIANIIIKTYKLKGKVLIAGNGGSAADSQHIAAELVSKFLKERKPLNAIALTTDTSILTSISNDYHFEHVFSRQIEAYANKNDVFIAISTSGNSDNIINALKVAKTKGVITIGLTGNNPNKMDELCDYIIKVPSTTTSIIQEAHIMVAHIICAIVEESL